MKNDEGWQPYEEIKPEDIEKEEGLEPAYENHKYSAVDMTWRFMQKLLRCSSVNFKLKQNNIVMRVEPTQLCTCDSIRITPNRHDYQSPVLWGCSA